MKDRRIIQGVGCTFLVLVILFVGFNAIIVSAIGGGISRYDAPFILSLTAALVTCVVLAYYRILRLIGVLVFLLVTAVVFKTAVLIYEYNRVDNKGIPPLEEADFSLSKYEPFAKNTKAARLPEPSSFRITSRLPQLDGATALYPLYAAFAQAVYPKKKYDRNFSEVECNNTSNVYKSLTGDYDHVDIAFLAGPSDEQRASLHAANRELRLTAIGREAFVFFVNAKNPVRELSVQQIKDIYAGKITNWNQVGGRNERIRAFQRPEGSGSQTMLKKIMGGRELMTPPLEDVPQSMSGIITSAADYRNFENAIGFSFLFFTAKMVNNDQIRMLKVDGVYPCRESIRSKKYPFVGDFYAVTAGSKNPNVEPFIKWILSPQGQYLVEKTGYTAINPSVTPVTTGR